LDGEIPPAGKAAEDVVLLDAVRSACEKAVPAEFERFAFASGLETWMGAVFACNAYVDAAAPWALRKTNPARMAEVLGTLVEAILMLTEAVEPVIPESAHKLIDFIRTEGPIGQPEPIFPRLELDEAAQ
jgi:methionyl-tRNA synthetase